MSEFHFLWPGWFLMLIPVLVLLVMLWRRRGHAAGWQAIVAPRLLSHLLLDEGHVMRRFPLVLLGLGWLLAVTALAGPTWERQPQPVYRAPIDRVMVLDMSPSMAAVDLKPDRLTRARFAIQSLLDEAKEGRTALVVFGAEPHVVAPLTDDTATIEALLPALTTDILPAPGDRGGPALRMAAELLQRVGSARGEVLLLSDGVSDPADTLEAIQDLRRRDVSTSVLGVGTLAGAPAPAVQGGFEAVPDGGVRLVRLDESGLATLAQAGDGRYQRLGEGPVTAILEQSAMQDLAQARTDPQAMERWIERGPWLLLPLVLIAAGGFRRGWLSAVALLLIMPPPTQAFDWQDLWLRNDQQAARLLEQGEASIAAERFANPQWRAMARYQAGDYVSAAEGFAGGDANSSYNRGNALARAGRLQEALAAYDEALEQQPEHEDARFNRVLVEKLLQSQQQSSNQQTDSGSPPSEAQTGQAQQQAQQGNAGNAQQGSAADAQQGSAGEAQQGGAGDTRQGNNGAGQQARQANPGEEDQSQRGGAAVQQQASGEPAESSASVQADAAPEPQPENAGSGAATNMTQGPASQVESAKPDSIAKDSAVQARTDVAGAAGMDTPTPPMGAAAHTQAQARPSDAVAADEASRDPLSEQQIALEQWLRQVPDDPAGLLRRKFMLEHLLRQKGHRTP